jgi:hypothetical protein
MPHNSAAVTTPAKRDGVEDLIHERIAVSRPVPADAHLCCG